MKKTFLLILLLGLGLNISTGQKLNEDRPNIVIVLADDLGYSDIGAYGSEISTPNLDELAKNGIRFTQMHNTSKCFPSRAILLTGLYAQQVGMDKKPENFTNGIFFGEVLKRAGYTTLFVGKHHSTDNPYDWGFDHYYGLRDGAANYFNPGLQRPGEPMPAQKRYGKRVFAFDGELKQPYTPPADYYATTTWTDWACDFLKKYAEEEKPFLLYMSYQAPHDPLQAPESVIQKYEGVYDVGYEAIAAARYKRQIASGLLDDRYPRSLPTYPSWSDLNDSIKADQVRRMQVYAAMIDELDRNIGRLIEVIKESGEWDNTVFMFLSDNGASAEVVDRGEGQIGDIDRWASLQGNWSNVANTPFRHNKNASYEGGTATPFIFHWPRGLKNKGSVNHQPLHLIDIMPTLIELSQAEYPRQYKGRELPSLQGVNILPLVRGEDVYRASPLYFDWQKGSALRTEDWKLVRWKDTWELYNMKKDRTETQNLAQVEEDRLESMKLQWQKWAESVGIPYKN
ncbi:arylsulfatase [Membranihabitans marinus]|uniref:arylsulfatase n=1 Tax=Membranihabitans marinus TaxID=1227546 RepID=UPI001F15ADFA|nr:arylsulfatase [Membranihabitans marinus]